MYRLLRFYLPALLLPAVCTAAPRDTFQIRNACQGAQAWAKLDTAHFVKADSARYQLLLGSLIWYAGLQDQQEHVSDSLFARLAHYPALSARAGKLFNHLYPAATIFRLKDRSVINQVSNERLRNFLTNALSQYDTIGLQEKRLRAAAADVKRKFGEAQKLNSLLLELKDLSIYTVPADTAGITLRRLAIANTVDTTRQPVSADSFAILTASSKALDSAASVLSNAQGRLFQAINDTVNKYPGMFFDMLRAANAGPALNSYAAAGIVTTSETFSTASQAFTLNYHLEAGPPPAAFRLPSQSEMIDAVAIYLAKRMKQEAVMWFFETITRDAARYELISTFFPNTITLLRSNEVYEIPNMGAQWKYALSKDFVRMPEQVLTSNWLRTRCPDIAKYQSFIQGATAMAGMLQDRYAYRDIIAQLYMDRKLTAPGGDAVDFGTVITLLYAINTELYVPDSAQRYRLLRYEDYRTMSATELELMLSLMDMKYGQVYTRLLAGMQEQLRFSEAVSAEDVRRFLTKAALTMERVETVRGEFIKEQDALKEQGGKDWEFTTYNVWTAASRMWTIFDTTWTAGIFSPALVRTRKAFWYTGELFESYNLIAKKNYTGAVNNTLRLIDTIFYSRANAADTGLRFDMRRPGALLSAFPDSRLIRRLDADITDAIAAHDTARLQALMAAYRFTIEDGHFLRFGKTSPMAAILFDDDRHAVRIIRKLGAFLNDAALAQNDKQLARAIESYAMPPGSYKRKRSNWWSLDLNVYGGAYIGNEWAFRKGTPLANAAGVVGFSVPIGLTLSKTFGVKLKPGRAVSGEDIANPNRLKLGRKQLRERGRMNLALTASIVDLGAAVSYRLSNTTADTLPHQVKWEQFLSPGLHLALSLPQTPLVVMGGAQFTPKLRKITENEQQYNAFRVYLGLYFDLPLLNLWERRRIRY